MSAPSDRMPGDPTMTARQFAGLLGILLAIAAVIALSLPISADSDSGMTVDCGSALAPETEWKSGERLSTCEDALGTRQAWSWPLGIVGLVVLAGAMFIQPARPHEPRSAARDTP